MYDLLNSYYEVKTGVLAEKMYAIGQVFDAPASYPIDHNPMHILRGKYNPSKSDYDLELATADRDAFRTEEQPIHPLKLRSNERAAIVRCKFRPVILLSNATDESEPSRRHGEAFLVAPVYGFSGDDGKTPYPQEFMDRVKAYAYNAFFYLPDNGKPFFSEGFVRFDRIQVVHKNWLTRRTICLNPEAVECLQSWLGLYIANELTNVGCAAHNSVRCLPGCARLVLEYREMKLEELGLAK